MTISRKASCWLLLATTALAPHLAWAAEADDGDRSDNIIVNGQRVGDSFTTDNSQTALKMNIPLLKTPQAIQVIPQEIILAQSSNQLSDVLRNVSGITDNNSFGGVQDNFNIRGFNTDNNETLRDGYMNVSDRSLNAAVERVEVLKGPSSLLYGRFSPGGLVNVVTKKPLDTFYANASASFSSRGQRRQSFDVTGPLGSNIAVRLVGEHENSDPWRNVGHDPKSKFIAPSIRIGDDTTSLLAQYEYFDNDQGFDRGRVAFNGKVVKTPATRSFGENFGFFKQKTHNANLLLSHNFGSWQINAKASGQWDKSEDLQVRPNALLRDADGNLTGFFRRSVDGNKAKSSHAYYFSLNISGKVETGPLTHNVLFGVDHSQLRDEGLYSVDSNPRSDFNIFDPVYGLLDQNLLELEVVPDSNFLNTRRSTGFYVQDMIEIGKQWSVTLGARYDRFSNYTQSGTDLPSDDSKDDAFLPRVAVLYQPVENVSVYASYSRSFKPNVSTPALPGQPAFGPFAPEKGRGYEVGLKARLFSRLNLTLAAFDIKKQNVLRSETDGNGDVITTASAEVTSKGIEFDIAGEITPELSVIASYSHIKARDPENVVGNERRQNVSPQKATIAVLYRPGILPGLTLGGGVYHYGRRYGGLAGTPSGVRAPFYLDSYTTMDLNAGYEVALGAGLPTLYTRVTLRNVTNKDFDQMSNGDLRVDPGMPRTLYGTVGIRF